MKKTILTSGAIISALTASAQLPVSTAAENKKVILEEFTGIYCGYCPQGHAIGNDIQNDNPGNAFVINIHTSAFAQPQSSNDPDFRTTFGDNIAGEADITGFPAASVNRQVFNGLSQGSGFAMSRGDWEDAANQILAQSSYVNIALEGTLDAVSRELIVDVELYFTGTAPSTVNLNIALLQDHIEGRQSGAAGNPSGVLPNGNYDHNHVFRHLLTGQWGDVITTSQGNVITQQYTYTIPTDLNDVAYELSNLHLVGFVAEGQENIITGNSGPINITFPAGVDNIDVSASTDMAIPTELCDLNITPEIVVTNNGTATLDTVEVSYTLNSGTPVTEMLYQNIAAGQSYTHAFPSITVSPGENVIRYEANTDQDLTSLDITASNDVSPNTYWYTIPSNSFSDVHEEGFESYQTGQSKPNNAVAYNPGRVNMFVIHKSLINSVSWELGAYENSSKSYFWHFYNTAAGKSSSLIWEKLDFSNNTGYALSFSHAHAQYNSSSDKLDILVSTDCGNTWTSVWREEGASLATAPAVSHGNFFPKAADWTSTSVDLSAYDGEEEVLIKFEGISDYGNNLYLDDIFITWPTEVEETFENELSLFPNPANGSFNISYTAQNTQNTSLIIYDYSGKQVDRINNVTIGHNQLTYDATKLETGLYNVVLIDGNKTISQTIAITH